MRMVAPSYLTEGEPFKSLFPIDPQVLEAITENMREYGYDESKPIDVWRQGGVVVDGYTRLAAATAAGIEQVPIYEHDFAGEEEAIAYAIHNQRDRRNLTDADMMRCMTALKMRGRGRPADNPQDCAFNSTPQVAELLGVSPRKVEQIRTVIDHANEETRHAVEVGGMSINQAYNETQQRRREEPAAAAKPQFNRTNDNIEWASWSWNPVTGCLHGCEYCYARDIANRFYAEGFAPKFHPERLTAPANTRLPISGTQGDRSVFVCSMADLFGSWVPQEWIDAVMESVRNSPDWTFIFLTKNPARMATIDWPRNAWAGTTVDVQARVAPAQAAFVNVNAPVRFVSCEPLLDDLDFDDMSMFDWLIIGGQSKSTRCEEFQPEFRWVWNMLRQWEISGHAVADSVYWKPNLKARPRAYPAR